MTLQRVIYLVAFIALVIWMRIGYKEDKQFVEEYHECVERTNSINNCLDELEAKRKAFKES